MNINMKMLELTKLCLIIVLLICVNGNQDENDKENDNDETKEKIKQALSSTGDSLKKIVSLSEKDSFSIKDGLDLVKTFIDIGSVFFPELKAFSVGFGALSSMLPGPTETKLDEKIMSELAEIKGSMAFPRN